MPVELDATSFNEGTRLIPATWDELISCHRSTSDAKFLEILARHGFGHLPVRIPLAGRYTKGRRWTSAEFESCYRAWIDGVSLTLTAAALNRNPQDIIYKLLRRCTQDGIPFTERGRSEGCRNWSPAVHACATELFQAGLPAWKIAVLFRVDFEHVEKLLFVGRKDYGHKKKNPFGINTDHKHFVNREVLRSADVPVTHVLDAFAGEGRGTRLLSQVYPKAQVLAVEMEAETFARAQQSRWEENVQWLRDDNRAVLSRIAVEGRRFDLIDLDPFVTCHEQVPLAWRCLSDQGLLFVTFGGEYRRSFIGTNRKAVAARYGFHNDSLTNQAYLEIVPNYFLGWIALHARDTGCRFQVLRAVRYANTCRFWLRTERVGPAHANRWFSEQATASDGGWRYDSLEIPRFREVRREMEINNQGDMFG